MLRKGPLPLSVRVPFGQLGPPPLPQKSSKLIGVLVLGVGLALLLLCVLIQCPPKPHPDPWVARAQAELLTQERQQHQTRVLADDSSALYLKKVR